MSADDASMLPDLVAGRLSTAVVSDILDDLGHRDHVLDPGIRPLGDAPVIAGWANPFLVAEVDEIPAEPYTGEHSAQRLRPVRRPVSNRVSRPGLGTRSGR